MAKRGKTWSSCQKIVTQKYFPGRATTKKVTITQELDFDTSRIESHTAYWAWAVSILCVIAMCYDMIPLAIFWGVCSLGLVGAMINQAIYVKTIRK